MSIKKKYAVVFSVLFLYGPLTVLCQPLFSPYNTKLIKNEQQANSKGFLLYKGHRGFIWIGSNDGACRYDGRNFKNYNIKDGLTQNYIIDIKEDKDWKLYIASPSGISYYTGAPNQPFTPLTLPAAVLQISTIVPEHINKIWIADEISRAVWLYKNNKTYKVDGIDEPIYQMVKDSAGVIYALSRLHNLYIIKNDRLLLKTPLVEPNYSYDNEFEKVLQVDNHGNAFCYGNALTKLSANKPYLTLHKNTGKDVFYYSSIPNKNKKRILYKSEDAKWIPISELPSGAKENHSIYVEKNGNILYTGETTGFYILIPKVYTPLPAHKLLHYGTMVNGTKTIKFDSALYNNKFAKMAYNTIGEKNILNLFKGKDETIWFCTYNGLYYLTQGKGKLKNYFFGNQNKDPNYNNAFIDVVEGNTGKTWFRTYNGLVCFEGENFLNWNSTNGLHDNTFYSIGVDGKGKVYAGANSLYAEINGIPVDISKTIGLKKADILSITTDKNGDIWVCPNTDKLYLIKHNNTGVFYIADSLTLEINEISLAIKSIAFDAVGNLWAAGTNSMVIYLLQPSGKFSEQKRIVLSKPQFLEDEKDERMPLGTNEDKTVIYLRNTAFNAAEVTKSFKIDTQKLVLTDIVLNYKKTNWWSFTDSVNQYGIPQSIELKYNENNLNFHFTTISIGDGFATRYSHKLQGLEDDWQPLTEIEEASYTNIPPGDYTFLIKSITQNGTWSEPIKFSFTIQAIWYKTTQAIILWGFLIAVLFILVSKYRINKIKYKARIDKLLVEQQLKALRAQINPHFIQNSLEFLMQSIEKESTQTIHNIVEQLSLYLRHILSMSDKHIVTLEDELEFSEEYLSINTMLFNRHFTYSVIIDPAIDTFSIKIPAMLLQPFLENALKHGVQFADGEKAVIGVKISQIGRFISCKVTNNYLSTKSEKLTTEKQVPKGLLITQERLSLLYPKEKLSDLIFFKKENNLYIATICIPV